MSDSSMFVCNMNALSADQRERHAHNAAALFAQVQAIRELPAGAGAGYAFRLPADSALLPLLADFITNERLCCPFFAFGVDVEPHGGALWLRLSGAAGIKPFITAEIGGLIPVSIEWSEIGTSHDGG